MALLLATHWIALPSLAFPLPVMLSVHPIGFTIVLGTESRKSCPGTQAYQNVPIFVVPVSVKVMP
jgi:hypothetical protein